MSIKFFAFTALLSLTSALRPTITERREVNTECWLTNPGTTFYNCGNGYVGCFEKDPCALPPAPTATPKVSHEITKPRSYNIYPKSTAEVELEDPVPHIDLKKEKGRGIVTTNAIVFDNVPANAKNCLLKWRTDGKEGGSGLAVSGSGLIYSRQLLGFPGDDVPVTFTNLKPFQNTAEEFSPSMDTTGWAGTIESHNGPSLKCAEQVAVEMYGDDAGGEDDRIFMINTETNGMYLTYDL
jgi:hypothetical protein